MIREWFKTDFGEGEHSGANQAEVRRWYKDYLECLYKQLRGEFPQFVLNGKVWAQSVIHFIFSVPATWDTRLVEEFCVLARQAGFGSQDTFLVKATLTEPHAVAAYTLSSEGIIKVGDLLLVEHAIDRIFSTLTILLPEWPDDVDYRRWRRYSGKSHSL